MLPNYFLKWLSLCIPISNEDFSFFTFLPKLILSVSLLVAILVGVKWFHILVLICVFLMVNALRAFHVLIILSVHILSPCFKSGCLFVVMLEKFFILESSPLSDIWFTYSFSCSLSCYFLHYNIISTKVFF